jgi:hypothetical protein
LDYLGGSLEWDLHTVCRGLRTFPESPEHRRVTTLFAIEAMQESSVVITRKRVTVLPLTFPISTCSTRCGTRSSVPLEGCRPFIATFLRFHDGEAGVLGHPDHDCVRIKSFSERRTLRRALTRDYSSARPSTRAPSRSHHRKDKSPWCTRSAKWCQEGRDEPTDES